MGTRINALFDYDLTDYRDRQCVLERLAAALPAALAVRDYWDAADPQCPDDNTKAWRADHVSGRELTLHHYAGPGSLFLTVTPQAARMRTGGRWRGFLSIEQLRCVHLAAFCQIAGALGSESIALYADSCEIDDLFWGGRGQGECIEVMREMWGPPQPSVENIDPRIAEAAERTVPLVWFLESIRGMLV